MSRMRMFLELRTGRLWNLVRNEFSTGPLALTRHTNRANRTWNSEECGKTPILKHSRRPAFSKFDFSDLVQIGRGRSNTLRCKTTKGCRRNMNVIAAVVSKHCADVHNSKDSPGLNHATSLFA